MDSFIQDEVSKALQSLSPETEALWGTMNASEMLQHLKGSLELTYFEGDVKILTPADKLEASRAFVLSDKPLPRGAMKPKEYENIESNGHDFSEQKKELVEHFQSYAREMTNRTDFKATHPYFGELNGPEWVHFQKKHFRHHLAQFGLMERDQPL
jgi:hypothetical protein